MTAGPTERPTRAAQGTRHVQTCPHGIAFDLDGTLVDTAPELHQAINESLIEHHLKAISIEQCCALIGRGMTQMVEVVAFQSAPRDKSSILKRYRTNYARLLLNSRLFPGVARLLNVLVDGGTRIIVVTNKPQEQAEHILSHLCPNVTFERIVGAREGHPLKPSQDLADELDGLRSGGGSWAFVGDTPIDMEFAKRAKMIPCAAAWGYRDRTELLSASPMLCASSPAELMSQLGCRRPSVTEKNTVRPVAPLDYGEHHQ